VMLCCAGRMWEQSMKGMMDNLVRHTDNGFTYIAEKHGGEFSDKVSRSLYCIPLCVVSVGN